MVTFSGREGSGILPYLVDIMPPGGLYSNDPETNVRAMKTAINAHGRLYPNTAITDITLRTTAVVALAPEPL